MAQRELTPFGVAAHFYECPRWHAGRWWVSDMRGGTVYSLSEDGEPRVELRIEDRPSGLGFAPDGAMLVVSMEERELLRVRGGKIEQAIELAHLTGETRGFINDMAVSAGGHAYIGFDADYQLYPRDAGLGAVIHVTPDGEASVAATGLAFPNGMVFSPDNKRLIVHETFAPQVTAYDIAADGSLGRGEVWASLETKRDEREDRSIPLNHEFTSLDGCGIDAEGCLWSADVASGCLRIAEGGAILDAIFLPDGLLAMACWLGGKDGHTLMICAADNNFEGRETRLGSQLFTTRVDVGAG